MSDEKKKEKVLHTRISESLENELKEASVSLGVTVSNLVRNILQNTVGLVDDVMSDSIEISRTRQGRKSSSQGTEAPRVIGWQKVFLSLNAVCKECNEILAKGSEAGFGVGGHGEMPIICLSCLEKIIQNN